MEQVRIVVIGFGGMGSQYAELIDQGKAEGLKLAGICCRNKNGQEKIRASYPHVSLYSSVEETMEHSDEFDAVLIVTPHDTHASIGTMAFERGLHVFCDKPAGISAAEAKLLNQAAQKAGTAYAMMFHNRTNPAFRKLKQMIEEGAAGKITRAVWICNTWYRTPCYHRSAPWRSTWEGEHGGLLINQCQHFLDLWQWVFGMPDQVDALIDYGKYNQFEVDDSVDLRFLYSNGFLGTFISSSGENPGVNRLEVWGDKGKLTLSDGSHLRFDENIMTTEEFGRTNTEIYGELEHHEREIIQGEEPSPYAAMLKNFADHVRLGTPLTAPGKEGLYSLELANAAYLSDWRQQRITLPTDQEEYLEFLKLRHGQNKYGVLNLG